MRRDTSAARAQAPSPESAEPASGALGTIPLHPRVADDTYDALRTAILSRELLPGARLSVPRLAQQLHVSRSPVREAVQRLVQNGLATEEPRRGAAVASLAPAEVVPLYELREVLEGLAARLACARASRGQLELLESVHAEHVHAVERSDHEQHIELDLRFHAQIRAAARNAELAATLERVQGKIAIAMLSADTAWHQQAVAEHELVLGALQAGDPDAAEVAARAHIARVRHDIAARFSQGGR